MHGYAVIGAQYSTEFVEIQALYGFSHGPKYPLEVYIEGELRTREWEKEGQKHYSTEVIANEMQMLDSRGDMPAPTRSNETSSSPAMEDFGPPPADDFDDDIPF